MGSEASWNRRIVAMMVAGFLVVPAGQMVVAQHAAHDHGAAQLNIALESGTEFIAELNLPADAAYGFEHAPRNAAEEQQKAEARERLLAGVTELLTLDESAGCTAEGRFADSDGHAESEHGHAHDGHGEDGDGHDDHGDDDHDAEHGHDDHDDHDGETHADVRIEWSFRCRRSVEGTTLKVRWSELLPSIEELEVVVLSATRQDAVELRGGRGELSL